MLNWYGGASYRRALGDVGPSGSSADDAELGGAEGSLAAGDSEGGQHCEGEEMILVVSEVDGEEEKERKEGRGRGGEEEGGRWWWW